MVTLGTIIPALDQGDWFTALDLRDAYFHIPIHPAHRRFLQFTITHNHFQYRVPPFRLSTAPRVFSKTLALVVVHLHRHGITLFPYLDDCLIKGNSYGETLQATHFAISLFHSLGLQINIQKSTLTPAPQIEFIGAHLDSIQSRVSLPNQIPHYHATDTRTLYLSQDTDKNLPTAPWSHGSHHLRGPACQATHEMSSELAQLQLQTQQTHLRDAANSSSQCSSFPTLVDKTRKPLHLCSLPATIPNARLTMDASLISWGAHLGGQRAQGQWSTSEMCHT
ncbi:unnamed protein product [Lepidochelys kempii]